MTVKRERIAELSGKFNGFADFENVADRGSAVNWPRIADSTCQEVWIVDPKQTLDCGSETFLVGMLAFSPTLCLG